MYKYETHLHTSPVSRCASADVETTLEYYKSLGYDGVFITNHFLDGNLITIRKERQKSSPLMQETLSKHKPHKCTLAVWQTNRATKKEKIRIITSLLFLFCRMKFSLCESAVKPLRE